MWILELGACGLDCGSDLVFGPGLFFVKKTYWVAIGTTLDYSGRPGEQAQHKKQYMCARDARAPRAHCV